MATWGIWPTVGVALAPIAITLAYFVWRSAPQAAINRRLAWILLVEGVLICLAGGLTLIADSVEWARAYRVAAAALVAWIPLSYARFLGLLPTPMSAFLSHRVTHAVLALYGVGLSVLVLGGIGFHIHSYPGRYGSWDADWEGGASQVAYMGVVVTNLLSLLVALLAMRHARGAAARKQARTFALAFGIRDLVFMAALTMWAIESNTGTSYLGIQIWGIPATNLAPHFLVGLLAYGLLRLQLFDIELRVKIGISRTTVAALIASAAFLGSELIEQAVGVNQTIPAIFIAAGAALAFRPLVSLGNRVADALLPGVENSEEYRLVRKLEVYQSAFESAQQDGQVTRRERDVLRSLAKSLDLSDEDVVAIENGAA